MTQIRENPHWTSAAAAIAAITLNMAAHAEYRCATPAVLANEERHACELASRQTPAALIHFVNRTRAVYGLYVNDYVSNVDVRRWETAERRAPAQAPAFAQARAAVKSRGQAD
jgi:hypothetical protein